MKKHIRRLSAMVLAVATTMLGASVYAATLNDIFQVAERMNVNAKKSQAKIDALNEDTRKLLSEYKIVLKEIEGLRVYNRQLEKQIANQEKEMAQLSSSIDEVTVIERQITPLMLRMIDGLEQFVELDVPFCSTSVAIELNGCEKLWIEQTSLFQRNFHRCCEHSRLRMNMDAPWKPTAPPSC